MTHLQFVPGQPAGPESTLVTEHLRRFLAGSHTSLREVHLDHSGDMTTLVPPGLHIDRLVRTSSRAALLASSPDATLSLSKQGAGFFATATAATDADVDTLIDAVAQRCTPPPDDGLTGITVWSLDRSGSTSVRSRRLRTPCWDDIATNYPASTRALLEQLTALERPQGRGRLVLWHGAPGTGKTTAIRALMRAWEPWCNSCYIADPERLFEQAHYLNELLALRSHRTSGDKWNLIVAEDTDAYLQYSPDSGASAAMGRLLNAADGILGQGAEAIILLTTNEPLTRLHPAITRPGRCLAIVEFDRFSLPEAHAFLGHAARSHARGPATLAELLVIAGEVGEVQGAAPEIEATGTYL